MTWHRELLADALARLVRSIETHGGGSHILRAARLALIGEGR